MYPGVAQTCALSSILDQKLEIKVKVKVKYAYFYSTYRTNYDTLLCQIASEIQNLTRSFQVIDNIL